MSSARNNRSIFGLALALPVALLAACGGDDDGQSLAEEAAPVVEQHAAIVLQSYSDSLTAARALDVAIDAFLLDPTEETLATARTAWIAARVPYRPTEVYRFYGGPIDDPLDEREPQINAWPLDEAYIDSVAGMPNAGIVNDVEGFPTITAEVLAAANFVTAETAVATGYHAIEFLLWGQDTDPAGPGHRPATDFITGKGATLENGDRRRAYLAAVSDLLVADLEHVAGRWSASGDYYTTFTSEPVASLTRMLTGIGTMAAGELSGERMLTAYENKEQEDEHSCFSDTTLDDIKGNAQGIENVYLGKLGAIDGPGLDQLVAARNPELDAEMKTDTTAALTAIAAIPGRFDQAILDETSPGVDGPGRTTVKASVDALRAVGDTVKNVADELGVPVSTELE
jgi:putative iron-regulated protein